jgi:hypothetical protein
VQFTTRTKEAVLADLREKLRGLPMTHPDHQVLARMVRDLGSELEAEQRLHRKVSTPQSPPEERS